VVDSSLAIEIGKWLAWAWLAVRTFVAERSGKKADAQLTGTGSPEQPTIRDLVFESLEAGKQAVVAGKQAAKSADMAAISAARSEDASARAAESVSKVHQQIEEGNVRRDAHLQRIDERLDLHEKKLDELFEKHGSTTTIARAAAHGRRAIDVAITEGADPTPKEQS
jgi:hypothetical protein